ncbi:MAG TPA: type VI secretion system tube protein TssD [Flavobacterium sp.]|jgi:hypothetical protein
MNFLSLKLQANDGHEYNLIGYTLEFKPPGTPHGGKITLTMIEPSLQDSSFLDWLSRPKQSLGGRVTFCNEIMSKTKEFIFSKADSTSLSVGLIRLPGGPVKITAGLTALELVCNDGKYSGYSQISIN